MCRADVAPVAEKALAAFLRDIRDVLAVQAGVDPETVLIGPVDFGPEPHPRQSSPGAAESEGATL